MNQDSNGYQPVPAVGVGAVVFNSRREVLLIRRNQAPASGLWSVPGGKVEPGETFTAAVVREVAEETGLAVRPLTLLAVVERRLEGFHYIILDFLAELTSPENREPFASTDVSDVAWIALEHLDNYALVPGLHKIIVRADRALQAGQVPGLSDDDGLGSDFVWPPIDSFTDSVLS
ncbi:MAG: NUDIX hydrolase [Gammaproteobacteria bacterium]